ncbi:MAG TPA: hypothetical protein VMK83_06975 [Gaiellaceae bacterium]|nr:hypothetical protein [Gaiellaceae bacterium]
MKRRIWTVSVGLAALAALVAVPAAMAAYTSPKLEVRQAGAVTTVKASLDPNDDPTASVRIFAPAGTQLTTSQAPGAVLGPVRAIVKALDLAGADLPLEGQLVVAGAGQVPPATAAACTGGATPLATWLMVLSAAGQTLTVPTYLIGTTGAQAALGPAYIQICLPPPDVPAGTPGRATFGAKVYSAQLAIGGVFSSAAGAWIGVWTPYTPLVGAVNVPGTVASPAAIARGAVTLTARRSGKGATLAGVVTQAGQARAGATVAIFGAARATGLKRLGRVRANANGRFTFRARTGTFFRANATATPGTAAALCTQLSAALAPIPCVNPTVNGFAAQSRVIRKR